jgi:hypothetical protein
MKKAARKTTKKTAQKATSTPLPGDRFDLKFHTDVNGEVGKTTVTVLDREPDSEGRRDREVYTDKLHLDADRERGALAGRIAKAVGQGGKDAWKRYIDLKWFASLKQAETFQKLMAAGSPEAVPGTSVSADGVTVTVVPDARGSPGGGTARTPGPDDPTRPSLRADNPEEHLINDAAVLALAREENLYHRGGELARVVREHRPPAEQRRERVKRQEGAPRILPVGGATLREVLSRCVYWEKAQEEQIVQAHPPSWCVRAVASRGVWPGLRYLDGVVEAPTIRGDGSVLDRPGYDPATGLIYEPGADFPPLPVAPSREDARRVALLLYDVVEEFPFLDDNHKAVWLAALLTLLARPAVEGPTPLFLFDAATAGSGKTLLTKVIGLVATGREPAVSGLSDDNEEMRKTITAIALEGERMVLLDNASGAFGCRALDEALTSTSWRDRILGQSKRTGEMPLTACWFATGNNVRLRGDTHRRVIPCRLEPGCERPEERSGFKYPDLLGHVREHRPGLVVAGLTILLAHLNAGRPKADLPHFGSYESWSDVVRQAVYWATGSDPWAARGEISTQSRGDAGTLAAIFAAWRELPGGDRRPGLTALGGLECLKPRAGAPNPYPRLRRALTEWAPRGEVLPSARQVGNHFRVARGRVVAGMQLRSAEDRDHACTWYVEAVSGPQGDQGAGSAGSAGSVSGHSNSRAHSQTRERGPDLRGPETDPAEPAEPAQPMTPGTPEPDDGGCDIPW